MRSISNKWERFRREHKTPLKLAAIALLCVLLILCLRVGQDQQAAAIVYPEIPADTADFSVRYGWLVPTTLDRVTQMNNPKVIDLSAVNGDLALTEGGEYRLTGELRGSVRVNAPESNVHLFLDGAYVSAIVGPALYCESADKLVITMLPGTENAFSDSGHYPADTEAEACVYSVCDLTLNGGGALNVNGLYKDGVRSKDTLKLLGTGECNVRSKRTAFHGNDGLYAEDGRYFISTEKNGMKTTRKGSDGRGDLIVAGGVWNVLAGRYTFVTTMADLVVYNCDVRQNAVIGTYDVGGRAVIDPECLK